MSSRASSAPARSLMVPLLGAEERGRDRVQKNRLDDAHGLARTMTDHAAPGLPVTVVPLLATGDWHITRRRSTKSKLWRRLLWTDRSDRLRSRREGAC